MSSTNDARQPTKLRRLQPVSSTPTSPAIRPEQIFPFFKLPRELRDQIHDDLLHDATTDYGERLTWPCLEVERGPRFTLLLLNRQFSDEYLEQMRRSLSITLTPSIVRKHSVAIPSVFAKCSHINIKLFAWDYLDMEEALEATSRWLKRFGNLQHASIKIKMSRWRGQRATWPASEICDFLVKFVEFPQITEMQVHPTISGSAPNDTFTAGPNFHFRWTPEGG